MSEADLDREVAERHQEQGHLIHPRVTVDAQAASGGFGQDELIDQLRNEYRADHDSYTGRRVNAALARLEAAETARDDDRRAVVEGVLALMRSAGLPFDEMELDVLIPHSNGYGCWFIGRDQLGTAPLTADEILAMIDARAARTPGTTPRQREHDDA